MSFTTPLGMFARLACSLSLAFLLSSSHAMADGVWDGGGDGFNWQDQNNWGGNSLPATGTAIVFSAGDFTTTYLGGNRNVESLTFGVNQNLLGGTVAPLGPTAPPNVLAVSASGLSSTATGGEVVIGSNLLNRGVDVSLEKSGIPFSSEEASQTWTNNGSSTIVLMNNLTTGQDADGGLLTTLTLAGSGAFRFEGVISDGSNADMALNLQSTGLVEMNGANTFTGGTTINNGEVHLNDTSGLGTGAIALNGSNSSTNGTTLVIGDGLTVGNDLVVDDTSFTKSLQSTGTATYAGNITTNESSVSTFNMRVNAGETLTVTGEINGTGKFEKELTGTLVLSGNNSHDTSVVSEGTLRLEHGNAGGTNIDLRGATLEIANGLNVSSNLTVNNTGGTKTLQVEAGPSTATYSGNVNFAENSDSFNVMTADASSSLTFAGVISGTGTGNLVKQGAGTVVFSADNSYAAQTIVEAGTLVIDGDQTAAVGSVTVDAGATLAGTGTIGGSTTISGTHGPGNSPGIQSFASDLTYNAGSNIEWELVGNTADDRGVNFDGINVGGVLDFAGTTNFDFLFGGGDFNDAFWSSDQQWTVFSGATSIDNVGNLVFNNTGASPTLGAFSFEASGGNLNLAYKLSAVPEPTAFLLFGIGLGISGLGRRRRRKLA